jgi:hypothetical protein
MNLGTQNLIIQISVKELGQLIETKVLEALKRYETNKANSKLLDKELLTIKETCHVLGIGRNAIYDRINKNVLERKYVAEKPYITVKSIKQSML